MAIRLGVTSVNSLLSHAPPFSTVVDKIWRPRRDLNPCYRRERAMS
jgi:hypothetical protein